jgi:hypothetical protein
MKGLERPVRASSRWRRRKVRRELAQAIEQLRERAERPGATVWQVQLIVEVCTAQHYQAWRKARERRWRREQSNFHTGTWPDHLGPATLAAVLLPQSHGGHHSGRPSEIAVPVFSHTAPPPPARDFEYPYEPLVLGLTAGWTRVVLANTDSQPGVLLAPPLVGLIGPRPRPRIPHDLGLDWTLEPSQPHINPSRRNG